MTAAHRAISPTMRSLAERLIHRKGVNGPKPNRQPWRGICHARVPVMSAAPPMFSTTTLPAEHFTKARGEHAPDRIGGAPDRDGTIM